MKNMKLWAFFLLVMGSLAFAKLEAQDEFEKVEVLDHPRYTLTKRFNLDAEFTFLPIDAYYKPLLMDVAGSYQFNDYISWEAFRVGFPIYKHNTKLNTEIENYINSSTGGNETLVTDDLMDNLNFRVSSMGFFNLLYSKSNFFNKSVIYHYWQIGAGGSYWDFAKGVKGGNVRKAQKQYAADVALRARFFLSENFMLNLRIAQTIGFNSKAPRNITQLGLGVGFAF